MNRVWVDANVLLRFLTGQPPDLAARARAFMEQADAGEVEGRLTVLVLAEVVWVLTSFYKQPMTHVAEVLVPLIAADGISIEDPDLAISALELAARTRVDFADAHLALWAQRNGEPICTFDRTDFAKLACAWVEPPLS